MRLTNIYNYILVKIAITASYAMRKIDSLKTCFSRKQFRA